MTRWKNGAEGVTGMARLIDKRLSVKVPPGRVSLHQVVRSLTKDETDETRRCIYCDNYTANLHCARCQVCLDTVHLDRFVLDPVLESDPRWQEAFEYMREHPERELNPW